MPKTITITVPDEAYDAMQAEAARTQRTLEQLATAAIAKEFGEHEKAMSPIERSRARLFALMRKSGHLDQSHPDNPTAPFVPIDPEVADELSDALEASGLDILDLIERR